MPIYDFYCEQCGVEQEIFCRITEGALCARCMKPMKKKCNCTNFKLSYNNKTDCCDWEGNSSNYWNDVKAARERGEKVKGVDEQ
jgi:predicted nucleic acid-binding Zn ribbon protein